MKKSSFKSILRAALASAILLSFAAWITPANYFQTLVDNDLIRSIKQKLSEYNGQLPEERIYVQFDKPMYEPGETIWFSAYLRNGETLKPSAKSDIIHVELINPKGTIEKSINLIGKNGKAAGDFFLGPEIPGGVYKVKAYSNWMKNFSNSNINEAQNIFEKEIQVQQVVLPNLKMKLDFEKKAFGAGDEVVAKLELNTNENKPLTDYKIKFVVNISGQKIIERSEITDEEGLKFIKFNLPSKLVSSDGLLNVMIDYNGSTESISRSIPIVLNKISFELFPEGGDLVNGLQSQVAFRARNEFNKPADVEGEVLTEKGSRIAGFSSFHQGMGAFSLTPQRGEKYFARITKPEGINETFELPKALDRGYVLSINNSKAGEVSINIGSSETEALSMIAQVRSKIYYSTAIDVKRGNNKIVFPTQNFPMGVCQVSLFDSKGIPRAERLAFLNKDRKMSISIETDKEKYLPREKVKMTITAKDERGMPVPANLSLAVTNDQFLSFADDKTGNIISQLLLEQDLKEKVDEPSFYFDDKISKSDEALDYLLMTSGWRHFTWEKVLSGEIPQVLFQGERAIVAGTVLDGNTSKPVVNAKIKTGKGIELVTDANGKFIFKSLELYDPVNLQVSASGYGPQTQYIQDYNQDLNIYLYDQKYLKRTRFFEALVPSTAMRIEEMSAVGRSAVMEDQAEAPALLQKNKSQRQNKAPAEKAEERKAIKVEGAGKKIDMDLDEVADARAARFEQPVVVQSPAATIYYRARQFAAPVYNKQENVEIRTDFRSTIYWNPEIEISSKGARTIEFYTSDDITSFRATAEGIGYDGSVGRVEKTIFTQLPFAMSVKVPVEVATEDEVSIPLTLKNNTVSPLGGILTITSPDGLKELVKVPSNQTIMPGKAKTIYLDYKVLAKMGVGEFTVAFKACGLGDAFTQKIKIMPKGFPVAASFSGQEMEKEFSFQMNKVVNGSVKATFTAFPNVVNDLMKGVEGILREPYGCFEQTSCSAYPNAMVLDYLKSTGSKDDKTIAYAGNLLDKGYKRLTTFETSQQGYEWFGQAPGHEGLTAYGLMEFADMKNAGQNVDQKMIDRTASWIMSHKDGKGGFQRNSHALHDFGRISNDILNGYIVYALAEAGYTDIKKEFESSFRRAMETKDPYMLAMMANAAFRLKDNRYPEIMNTLLSKQDKNGSWTGSTHSITYSQGQSLTIETTAITTLALLKAPEKNIMALTNATQFLVGSRSGSGVFSSTQGTILALKALTEYAKFSKKTKEDGAIAIYVDGKKVAERSYKAGEKDAIVIDGMEAFLKGEGRHDVKVKYLNVKSPLPYSLAVNWNTSLPNSSKDCAVELKTTMSAKTAGVGETIRFSTTITNKRESEIPSTMAIIGIPAGFSVQPWQLKEMQEKKVFDYYEIIGNNIAVYYRGMGPKEVRHVNLDLKAEIPGEYDAPASSAYLYYTNEFKSWSSVERVSIKKNS